MNKILFVLLLIISYRLKAQSKQDQSDDNGEFRPGLTKNNLRAFYEKQPQNFKVILETDTLDSFSFQGMMRINCFYKNDTCYKLQQIVTFDHRQIKSIAQDSYKKIAKNVWVKSDGVIEMKTTIDESKDLCIMEATVVNPKVKK
jgi:hypothetical protein